MNGNLFRDLPEIERGEAFNELLSCANVRIERILSSDTPEPVLYDQVQDEWVCLLRGEAELWVNGETVRMGPGDYRFIPARTPHRVVTTSTEPRCLWLAVHIRRGPPPLG
ncbi:MAG: cupin domain-containing protein [Thiocapsa sp.]|nr:cupin domain-containing protein [Thiocapsa sp.]MCG6896639.1 cupin domain-containing protein [Thiocapsa sp.]MCG6985347.1 cupin domain-containing protein [Thiocapsa sp.]